MEGHDNDILISIPNSRHSCENYNYLLYETQAMVQRRPIIPYVKLPRSKLPSRL